MYYLELVLCKNVLLIASYLELVLCKNVLLIASYLVLVLCKNVLLITSYLLLITTYFLLNTYTCLSPSFSFISNGVRTGQNGFEDILHCTIVHTRLCKELV